MDAVFSPKPGDAGQLPQPLQVELFAEQGLVLPHGLPSSRRPPPPAFSSVVWLMAATCTAADHLSMGPLCTWRQVLRHLQRSWLVQEASREGTSPAVRPEGAAVDPLTSIFEMPTGAFEMPVEAFAEPFAEPSGLRATPLEVRPAGPGLHDACFCAGRLQARVCLPAVPDLQLECACETPVWAMHCLAPAIACLLKGPLWVTEPPGVLAGRRERQPPAAQPLSCRAAGCRTQASAQAQQSGHAACGTLPGPGQGTAPPAATHQGPGSRVPCVHGGAKTVLWW